MLEIFNGINRVLWGPGTLLLFIGTGIFLMCRLRWMPWRRIGYGIRLLIRPSKAGGTDGDISSFQSLMMSLAACIGTGNIAGVASAMVLGGPGALVWMNISAMLGLSTAFSESLLTMLYRRKNKNGEMSGGPMYVMVDGIGGCTGKIMAAAFSVFTVGASFGIGNMTQSNTAASVLFESWHFPPVLTGLFLSVLTMAVIFGGVKSVGKFCGVFVPVAAAAYILCCLAVIAGHAGCLPEGLNRMFSEAFSVKAAAGGIGGTMTAAMLRAMKWGVARGVFSNEAGLGSAPIAAAAASYDNPMHQAYIQMTGPVFDTIIMCTMTGLAIAASGCLGMRGADGHLLDGVALTAAAFKTVLGPFADAVISISMFCFAIPTIIGWAYYGEKALEYLTDKKAVLWAYKIIYSGAVCFGAIKPLAVVWAFSDMMNGLMALPNLLTLLLLNNQVRKSCVNGRKEMRKG